MPRRIVASASLMLACSAAPTAPMTTVDAGPDAAIDVPAVDDGIVTDTAMDVAMDARLDAPPSVDVVPREDVPTTGPLPAPRQIAPAGRSVVTSRRPTLRWSLAPGTDGARAQVCSDRACATVELTVDGVGDHATLSADLAPGVHFWRVYGRSGATTGVTPGPTWQFVVGHRSASVETASGSLPDFDGDGLTDVAIGAPYAASQVGRVYVFPGRRGGVATTSLAPLSGPDGIERGFGSSLAAGDLNSDGLSDLVVGTRNASGNLGRMYVFMSAATGFTAAPTAIIDQPMPYRSPTFATALATVGDMDGDGYPEVAAGLPFGLLASVASSVIIYRGGPDGLNASRVWTLPAPIRWIHFGENHLASSLGGQIASAGDLNGDGLADLAIGAPADTDTTVRGHVYVYLGRPTGPSTMPSSDLVGNGVWDVEGYGRSAVGVGDVNGDGYGDLAVSAQTATGAQVWIYPGGAAGLATAPQTTIAAPAGSSVGVISAGPWVVPAGDLNGDGYADVAVLYEAAPNGIVAVHLGGATGLATAPATTFAAQFERALAGPGDLDGDGFDDLVVADRERALVYRGSATGLGATPAAVLAGTDGPGAAFGTAILGR